MKNVPLKPFGVAVLLDAASIMLYLYEAPTELTASVWALAFIGELHYGGTIYHEWQKTDEGFIPFLCSNLSFFSQNSSAKQDKIETLGMVAK